MRVDKFVLSCVVLSFLLAIVFFPSVSAFDFNVTLKYHNGTVVPGANFTLTEYAVYGESFGGGGPEINATFTNLSDSNGIVRIGGITNGSDNLVPRNSSGSIASDSFYALSARLNNSENVTYVGPIIPNFNTLIFEEAISGSFIYLEPAIGINITVYNSTNPSQLLGRGIDVVDGEFGNHLSASSDNQSLTDSVVYLPLNSSNSAKANYSFSFYGEAIPPMSVKFGPDEFFTSTCDMNSTRYNAGEVVSCSINSSINLVHVSGYFNSSSVMGWNADTYDGVNYLIMPGERIYASMGGAYADLGAISFFSGGGAGYNDTYNSTTGFFNVSIPAGEIGIESLLLFFGRNGSTPYSAIYNVSVNLTSTDITGQQVIPEPLNGVDDYFAVSTFSDQQGGSSSFNVSSSLTTFNITQGDGDSPRGLFTEITQSYSNGKVIKWTYAPTAEGKGATIQIPIINSSTVDVNTFAMGNSPKKLTLSTASLASNSIYNIEINSFERKTADDRSHEQTGSMKIEMFDYFNDSCNVPNPGEGCSLFNIDNASDSTAGNQAFRLMMLGKANVKMTDVSTNTSVMYVGVNLRQFNAPPADFGNNASEDSGNTTDFDQLWKFGSTGPETYNYVFVSIPYNDSKINESSEINVSVDKLYDTTSSTDGTWEQVWNNTGTGDGNTSAVENLSDYSAKFSDWDYLLNGTTCMSNVSSTNITNPCSMDNSSNLIYLRIPHFSGTGLNVNGQCIGDCTVDTQSGTGNSGDSGSSGSSSSSSGGSSNVVNIWKNTFVEDDMDFSIKNSINKDLKEKERVRIKIGKEKHFVGVLNITGDKVTIEVSSTQQQATLSIGEAKSFEVTGDNFYDINVLLDGIVDNKAKIKIRYVHDLIEKASPENNIEDSSNNRLSPTLNDKIRNFDVLKFGFWAFIVLIIVGVIFAVLKFNEKKSRDKNETVKVKPGQKIKVS